MSNVIIVAIACLVTSALGLVGAASSQPSGTALGAAEREEAAGGCSS